MLESAVRNIYTYSLKYRYFLVFFSGTGSRQRTFESRNPESVQISYLYGKICVQILPWYRSC